MKILPGRHHQGRVEHQVTNDINNVLLAGQTILQVDEKKTMLCELDSGEALFHHG
jgi:hypothetical protein